jgi:hypothetical protein
MSFILQYVPGPGSDITVTKSEAKARGWRDVIFTTQPRVAPRLPMPPTPAGMLTANNPGALVVNADSGQDLEVRGFCYMLEGLSAELHSFGHADAIP